MIWGEEKLFCTVTKRIQVVVAATTDTIIYYCLLYSIGFKLCQECPQTKANESKEADWVWQTQTGDRRRWGTRDNCAGDFKNETWTGEEGSWHYKKRTGIKDKVVIY